eukprot:3439601-Karenia_brevis.AAC.1
MKEKGKGRRHSVPKGKGKGERKLQRQILDALEPGIIKLMKDTTYNFKQKIQDMESNLIRKFTSAKESNILELDNHKMEISTRLRCQRTGLRCQKIGLRC